MMMLLYNKVDLANVVVVVPGRALKGVALGGKGRGQQVAGRSVAGAAPGFVGGAGAGRLGVGTEEREGRLDPGRAVVPGQRVLISCVSNSFFFLGQRGFKKLRFKCFLFTKSNSQHLSKGRIGGNSRSSL